MTFVPIRLAGDRITLKDGSHWTITEQFGRTGIDDYYAVENGKRSRFVYADEIASPAPVMRGMQSMGRALRPVGRMPAIVDHSGAREWTLSKRDRPTVAEWTRRFDAARTGPSIDELIASGHLMPFQARAFAALDFETRDFELTPDIGKVHCVGGDFDPEELRRAMADEELRRGPIVITIVDPDDFGTRGHEDEGDR